MHRLAAGGVSCLHMAAVSGSAAAVGYLLQARAQPAYLTWLRHLCFRIPDTPAAAVGYRHPLTHAALNRRGLHSAPAESARPGPALEARERVMGTGGRGRRPQSPRG